MIRWLRSSISALMLTLTACIPVVVARYIPHGEAEEMPERFCVDSKVLNVSFEKQVYGQMHADIATKAKPNSNIELSFTLHPLQVAKFEDTYVTVTPNSSRAPIKIPFDKVESTYPRVELRPSNQVMDGGPVGGKGLPYFISIPLPFEEPQDFTVQFPAIILNGLRYGMDPVRFTLNNHRRLGGPGCGESLGRRS